MNIGLLISEIEDKEVKKIIIGANQAAIDKGVTLVVMPGKYLISDATDKGAGFDYQYSAIFDYAVTSDLDALIVDIERIGSKTTILRKEAFLKKFEGIPVLTLSEQEGYQSVNQVNTEKNQFEQLGYEAVCDAAFYVKNQVLPPTEPAQQFNYVEAQDLDALRAVLGVSDIFLHKKFSDDRISEVFSKVALAEGITTCGILLYDKKARNTVKYPWSRPEEISVKAAIIDGKDIMFKEGGMTLSTDKIISTFAKSSAKSYILGDIFVGEYQLGLMISELTPGSLIDYCFDTIIALVTGASRLSFLENELRKTTEELYEVQEELARDDSVLDHIGENDYLTGGLNRRGFFARAYDLLKEKFVPGKSALVAYIHMESLKNINSLYGHEEGDRAVKKVAQILEEVFNDGVYGRIRGDEFAVIVVADEEGKAESLREEMSEQNAKLLSEPSRYINHLQYSICEFSHEENLSLREMLKETDENLQKIKGNM
ncbi:MAG: GGDEF domain-containing protein [Butyrivibrio sp.]|nr:GGDEF domain-containing protein [Butyrivibrio sp.]